jgi:hypothetical protein
VGILRRAVLRRKGKKLKELGIVAYLGEGARVSIGGIREGESGD